MKFRSFERDLYDLRIFIAEINDPGPGGFIEKTIIR